VSSERVHQIIPRVLDLFVTRLGVHPQTSVRVFFLNPGEHRGFVEVLARENGGGVLFRGGLACLGGDKLKRVGNVRKWTWKMGSCKPVVL
jgi:hypothetical protein